MPFIARYRKEVTGNLDDTQLRHLSERLIYLRELDARRQAILDSITEQGKLTPELAARIDEADSKQRLEDLYAPYKLKVAPLAKASIITNQNESEVIQALKEKTEVIEV